MPSSSSDHLQAPVRGREPSIAPYAQPLVWLTLAVAGFVLTCIGVAIDAYRHDHGAGAAELISFSSPGMLVSLAGLGMVGTGLLVGLSLVVFQTADSAEDVVRRGAGVLLAWIAVAIAAVGAITYVATAGVTIGHEGHGGAAPDARTTDPAAPAGLPGAGARATLRGMLTLDGAPLEADFLGVRVMRDGLSAACQYTIPAVTQGRYEIKVLADAEVRGCGAPGSELLLWAYANEAFIYSQQTAPWPGSGGTATFAAGFSSAAREGAGKPVTEFKGELFDREGVRLPGGTVVEAYVGDVRCGVTSLRYGDDNEQLYTLIVAGPESVPGCAQDATLTFTIDGDPVVGTASNDLGRGSDGHELNLTVE